MNTIIAVLEKKVLVESDAALRIGIKFNHPTAYAVRIELLVPRGVKRIGETESWIRLQMRKFKDQSQKRYIPFYDIVRAAMPHHARLPVKNSSRAVRFLWRMLFRRLAVGHH